MKDKIIRATCNGGKISIIAAQTQEIVEQSRQIHRLSPVCTAVLGKTLTIATMMGIMLKNEKGSLTMNIKGNGPIGSIVTVSDNKGKVKGYVDNPSIDLPLKKNGKLDISSAVGTHGRLTVIKDIGNHQPYVGQVNLQCGEIAEDFAYYFAISEQQPAAVLLGVLINNDDSVLAAGGILVQALPGNTEEELDDLEKNIKSISPISSLLYSKKNIEQIVQEIFVTMNVKIHEEYNPEFLCDCSESKIEKVIISLGETEILDIMNSQGKAEITCHFCNKTYQFDKQHLSLLLEKSKC